MPDDLGTPCDPWSPSPCAMLLSPQRDLMRRLARTLGDERDVVCRASVEAEREGRINRPRGAEDVAPDVHAKALWWKGRLKGWL